MVVLLACVLLQLTYTANSTINFKLAMPFATSQVAIDRKSWTTCIPVGTLLIITH